MSLTEEKKLQIEHVSAKERDMIPIVVYFISIIINHEKYQKKYKLQKVK